MKTILLLSLLILNTALFSLGQNKQDTIAQIYLKEIVITKEYQFNSEKEKAKYQVLLEDMRVVYPLLQIVRTEYEKTNKLLSLYEGKKKKEFLKWYENYANEKYLSYLGNLNVRQGRLFLKLISRELDKSPYHIIKEYRNGFRAALWQGTALFFRSNLKVEYDESENPMIEHIIMKLDAENIALNPTGQQ